MGEIKSALGATIITPRWDTELEDRVWVDYAAADTAIPVFRHGRLVEVTLWSEWADGSTYWRDLEHHSIGKIEHALFRGTANALGQRRPLQDRPETEVYAALVNSDSAVLTQSDDMNLTPQQFAIRVEEHKQTLDNITAQILQKAGYSPSAWGLGEKAGSQATATEIKHRDQRTETTRKKNPYDCMVL